MLIKRPFKKKINIKIRINQISSLKKIKKKLFKFKFKRKMGILEWNPKYKKVRSTSKKAPLTDKKAT